LANPHFGRPVPKVEVLSRLAEPQPNRCEVSAAKLNPLNNSHQVDPLVFAAVNLRHPLGLQLDQQLG
jgi:hypothetical protein